MVSVCGLVLGAMPASAAPEDFVEACSNGIAVPDSEDNPGLVQDCAVLLSIRDTLAGDATLDWSADIPILEWEGVVVSRTDNATRVTYLRLGRKNLTGRIPPEIGSLSSLEGLHLSSNRLTGEIPPEIGDLSKLQSLALNSNDLTGEIPKEFARLSRLLGLYLHENNLAGSISALRGLALNALTLDGNDLTGCVSRSLREFAVQDLYTYGLPDCPDPPTPPDTGAGLAPTPHGALPVAVNVFAVLALATAVLGIVGGLRTRSRP